MSKLKVLCLFWTFFAVSVLFSVVAQQYKVTGVVVDADTKTPLIGVTISIKENAGLGTATKDDGRYSLMLEKGTYNLIIRYIGYKKELVKITVNKDLVKNIHLDESSVNLQEVVVSTTAKDANVTAPQTGVERITIEQVNKLPVLFGERDVIKTMQLMPGVKAASEGGAGYNVRGGSSDQNLVLLDNVSVYNASHLMGFFSTFNPEAVKDAVLYKGAMPAQYGERLSSVLDVQTRDGNTDDFDLSGGLGLISSKLSIEGPFKKGKSSYFLGARRTYADALARASGMKEAKDAYLYFYDLNTKMKFNLSDKDYLTFTGYHGMDKMVLKDVISTDWGNTLASLKWSRQINKKWLMNTAFQYNRYAYNVNIDMGIKLDIKSTINDYAFKQDFQFDYSPTNSWRFGYSTTYHNLNPGEYLFQDNKGDNRKMKNRYSSENGVYASNTMQLSDKLEVIYGLRLSAFMALGKGEFYTINDKHEVTDSTTYKSGEIVKTYINLEPRLSMAYKLNDVSSLKAAYGRVTQNMHLLTNTAENTPYDRWTSSSNNIKPETVDQITLGYFRNFSDNMYEFSVEGYYKDMRNQIDFKDNARIDWSDDIETEILFGKGRAYGVEFMLRKTTGRLTGWLAYTLSKSEKKIDGINDNKWYDTRHDRTHDISIVGIYELTPKWTLSASWVYYTGNAVTYPSGKYQIDGREVLYYSERNGYRAPAYHRLDLGATRVLKKTKKTYSELSFSLYNAYGRENTYMIEFRRNDNDPSKSSAYQYSLFRFVPSISWNFKF